MKRVVVMLIVWSNNKSNISFKHRRVLRIGRAHYPAATRLSYTYHPAMYFPSSQTPRCSLGIEEQLAHRKRLHAGVAGAQTTVLVNGTPVNETRDWQ